jgi:hypothetical protein
MKKKTMKTPIARMALQDFDLAKNLRLRLRVEGLEKVVTSMLIRDPPVHPIHPDEEEEAERGRGGSQHTSISTRNGYQ